MTSYVPLRVRSHWSLLTGASPVESLLDAAVAGGLDSLALTDENNLYGAVPFFLAAKERGVRPILGTILSTETAQAILLARNATGYANLCTLLSKRHLDDEFSLEALVPEFQDGLFVLTPDMPLVRAWAGKLDPNRLWVEIIRPTRNIQDERKRIEEARRLGLGLVATTDVHFASPADDDLHPVLLAIRERTTVSAVRRRAVSRQRGCLHTADQMNRLFADLPNALQATHEIADGCEFHPIYR